MELTELKAIWDKSSANEVALHRVSDREIRAMISRKSKMTVADVKRTMLLKLWMAGCTSVLSAILSAIHLFPLVEEPVFLERLLTRGEIGVVFMAVSILLSVISIFNAINYRRIVDFEKSSEPLKHTLRRVIEIINIKIKMTIYSDLAFIPLLTTFISYVYVYQRSDFIPDIRVLYLLLIVCGVTALSYLFDKRILKRKFGDDLERLKGYLSELESLD